MTPTTNSAKSAVQAWLLIKVQNIDKGNLAKDIFEQVNKKFAGEEKVFVVSADVVDGPFDLVASVFTGTLAELDEIETLIKSFADGMELERATVTKHVPLPPDKTEGYIAYEEENPLTEKSTGHNPW